MNARDRAEMKDADLHAVRWGLDAMTPNSRSEITPLGNYRNGAQCTPHSQTAWHELPASTCIFGSVTSHLRQLCPRQGIRMGCSLHAQGVVTTITSHQAGVTCNAARNGGHSPYQQLPDLSSEKSQGMRVRHGRKISDGC
jgi:hypothetical protein